MQTDKDLTTSRRAFMQQISLFGVASMLPLSFFSCGKDVPGIDYKGSGIAPYKVWEEMLMAIKTSPDHLKGRMDNLIKNADPEKMLVFVRDEIHLIPPSYSSLSRIGENMRYGIRGVLRDGFATPREKAELLNTMYKRAGITSSVVYEQTQIKTNEVPSFFYRPFERQFMPEINDKILQRWSREMGGENKNTKISNVNSNFEESKKLADELWEKLPDKDKIRPNSFNLEWNNRRTPTIQFEWKGETKYAHLFDANVPFGKLRNKSNTTSKAYNAEYKKETVNVNISYRVGSNPNDEKILIQGQWPTHELVGNQIVLSFLHGLNLQKQITTPIGNLRTFTPALSFQSFDAEKSFMEERSFLGNPVTLEGEVIDVSKKKSSLGNSSLLPKPKPNLQKEIEEIEIQAVPGSYPLVKLEVSPRAANGEIIEGLSAVDFSFSDNKIPIQAILESNQQTPRVIILYDTSASMPFSYSDKNMDDFVDELQSAILEKYPNTKITKWETNSHLYTWLGKASQTTNDLIIFATDGDNRDEYDAEKMKKMKHGPPALVLNVRNTTQKHRIKSFEKMANATNGLILNAKDKDKTISNITAYIEDKQIPPYVFSYYATKKEDEHKIEITADNHRVKSFDKFYFKLKPNDKSHVSEHIIGLYLTLEIGRERVRRKLAGWDDVVDVKKKPTYKDFTQVRNMFLGTVIMSIEGEGPTLANALSDVLKYRLSTRKWGEAILQNKIEKAVEAYQEGGFIYDENLASLMQPLNDTVTNQSLTFASGPRISIVKTSVGFDQNYSKYSFDFLPTSKFITLSEKPLDAFKTTLEKTAQLAFLEHHFFETNTLLLLSSKNIISSRQAKDKEWFKQLYSNGPDARYWREYIYRNRREFIFFDRSASEKAFWRINSSTGELYGILPDLTGGGSKSIETQLNELSRVMNLYSLIFQAMGVGSLPVGIVTAYGLTLVKLYAIASEAIIIMDTSGLDEEVKKALQQLACNVQKEIMLATLGPIGEIMGGLDNLIGLMGGGGVPGMQC